MPSSAETFFADLAARALATAKSPPELVEVTPIYERGWLLSFALANSEAQVEVEAMREQDGAPALVFSYRPPEQPETRTGQRLKKAGYLLCRALERIDAGPVPELETPEEPVVRETLRFYLHGSCDRGCVFCSKTLEEPERDRPTQSESLPIVPSVTTEADIDLPWDHPRANTLEAIELRLRRELPRVDELCVAWTGQDCLASPDFDAALRLAYELGFREMSVQSPGSRLVEPGFIEFLREHSVTQVGLTAHAADEEVFDRVGGKVGAHRIFWASVEALLEAGLQVDFAVPLIAATARSLPRHLERLIGYPCGIQCFYWYPDQDMLDAGRELEVSLPEAIAALERAADKIPERRVGVGGIPPCVVPEHLRERYVWSYADHFVGDECRRIELCGACAVADECPGPVAYYLARRSWPASARPLEASG